MTRGFANVATIGSPSTVVDIDTVIIGIEPSNSQIKHMR